MLESMETNEISVLTMPAMALILVGCVIWIHRAYFIKEK